MNAITEILANARATSQLKPKFYWATSIIGVSAAVLGIALMYVVAIALAAALDLDVNAPVRESAAGLVWIGLFLAAIPLSILAAMVPVAWLGGHVLIRLGYMSREDLKFYALRSRYPTHWFKDSSPTSTS